MGDQPWRIERCEFLCEIPPELGAATGFKEADGKLYVQTESGIEMIVPVAWIDHPERRPSPEDSRG